MPENEFEKKRGFWNFEMFVILVAGCITDVILLRYIITHYLLYTYYTSFLIHVYTSGEYIIVLC